jgi:uncharacterized linocin/CFP29 family protein
MLVNPAGPAELSGLTRFISAGSGKWAGERFMHAIKTKGTISPADLRTNDLLRNEDWKVFDTAILQGARERIRLVADLLAAGLVKTIPNGLAKTVLEWDKITDMGDAIESLDGVTRAENDRLDFETAGLPLPLVHKDWYLNLRMFMASQSTGNPIDTTYATAAGRKVGEKVEDMTFNGGKTYGALTIPGLLTHPDRNIASFGTNGNWGAAAKTGDNILADIFSMITLLEAAGFDGPYWLYYGGTAPGLKLAEDYKAASDKTILQRIQEIGPGRISKVGHSSKIPASNVVMFQPTDDVVRMVEGEPLQTVQWDVHGGFQINFKAFTILVPNVRSDTDGNSGVAHMR